MFWLPDFPTDSENPPWTLAATPDPESIHRPDCLQTGMACSEDHQALKGSVPRISYCNVPAISSLLSIPVIDYSTKISAHTCYQNNKMDSLVLKLISILRHIKWICLELIPVEEYSRFQATVTIASLTLMVARGVLYLLWGWSHLEEYLAPLSIHSFTNMNLIWLVPTEAIWLEVPIQCTSIKIFLPLP